MRNVIYGSCHFLFSSLHFLELLGLQEKAPKA
jgi:hypothetical protein